MIREKTSKLIFSIGGISTTRSVKSSENQGWMTRKRNECSEN